MSRRGDRPELPLPSSLGGKSILVVGASAGIGAAAANLLAGLGANLTLVARDEGRLKAQAKAIRAAHPDAPEAKISAFDISHYETLNAKLGALLPLDHVFVSAAAVIGGPLGGTPLSTARTGIETRVYAAYEVARAFAEQLEPGGSITFTSGTHAYRPGIGTALISAGTAGVEAMTRALALELAPLRVNAIRPGATDTPLFRTHFGDQEAVDSYGAPLPLGRIASAEEVAACALAAMSNPYMTGSIILIDGGASLT